MAVTREDNHEEQTRAKKALVRAKEIEKERIESGLWEWVRGDDKSMILKRKKL